MPRKRIDNICKHCGIIRSKHEDWIATGEYAENAICPNTPLDKDGRYRKLIFFEPLSNLEYLEQQYEKKKRH